MLSPDARYHCYELYSSLSAPLQCIFACRLDLWCRFLFRFSFAFVDFIFNATPQMIWCLWLCLICKYLLYALIWILYWRKGNTNGKCSLRLLLPSPPPPSSQYSHSIKRNNRFLLKNQHKSVTCQPIIMFSCKNIPILLSHYLTRATLWLLLITLMNVNEHGLKWYFIVNDLCGIDLGNFCTWLTDSRWFGCRYS